MLNTSDDLFQAAKKLVLLAIDNPSSARAGTREVERQARRAGNWRAVSAARQAEGVAAKQQGDLTGAIAALVVAVRAAQRVDAGDLVAEARLALSGALVLAGHTRRALGTVHSAIAEATGVQMAVAQVQLAAILQSVGRDDDALDALRLALPVLKRAGEFDWTTRALSNRSLIYVKRRDYRLAEQDLVAARGLCREHGLQAWSAYVAQNLGWLRSNRGDVMAALEQYDEAAEKYDTLGTEVGSLEEAKARILLSLRLLNEARSAAERAVDLHASQNRMLELVDAELLLSTIARAQGDGTSAAAAADRAFRRCRRLDRPSGMALARYARLQAAHLLGHDNITHVGTRRCADDLAAAGWPLRSLEARILAGRVALARGKTAQAKQDLAQAAQARRTGPADLRAQAWLAVALLREAEGRHRAAKCAVSAGLRIVERYQATLGAAELRAHVSSYRDELSELGLRMAISDGNARQVLSFVERSRASALVRRSPQPPADPLLADLLTDLRATVSEIDHRRGSGEPTTDLVRRQVRIEEQVADRCRRYPSVVPAGSRRRNLGDLITALNGTALVEYVQTGDQVHAVALVEGRARLRFIGTTAEVTRKVMLLGFALRRMIDQGTVRSAGDAAWSAFTQHRAQIDAMLLGPLRNVIGDRRLVIAPSACLRSFPWAALPSLLGRSVCVTPSARLWLAASERSWEPAPLRIAVIAGPGLRCADQEAAAVAGIYDTTPLLSRTSRVSHALTHMEGADVVHVAAHGVLRSDNPFFSSLLLADGPLLLYELERLRMAPRHVVLAACEAASVNPIAVDELLGLAAVLLGHGASSLIAPVTVVADNVTDSFMLAYHRRLVAGMGPADALAHAQAQAGHDGGDHLATALSFVCVGAGETPIPLSGGDRVRSS